MKRTDEGRVEKQRLQDVALKLAAMNGGRLQRRHGSKNFHTFVSDAYNGISPMIILLLPFTAILLAACTTADKTAQESAAGSKPVSVQHGIASFYAGRWIGRKTANGEIYRARDRTAAHRTLPFNTRVRVTDKTTGKSTIVRINNRGPYVRGRVIDLSIRAAREIGLTRKRGLARVKLEVLPSKEKQKQARLAAKKKAKKDRRTLATLFAPKKKDG
jgi:rare lipoprotein A